jgi:ABC-2 type transport system permease protein
MFPYEAMPHWAQVLARGLPLTHFLRIVRGITLKGASFPEVRAEFFELSITFGVLVVLTSLRFSKKLG